MVDLVVIEYGIGNVFSVCNALKKVGINAQLTREPSAIRNADMVILPGVGAFSSAMKNLRKLGLDTEIVAFAKTGKPLLGICIGMQVLMDLSTEFGEHIGLGLIPGKVKGIRPITTAGKVLRIPHIAWSEVSARPNAPRHKWHSKAFANPAYYYFVHSYMAYMTNPDHLLATAKYGGYLITGAIGRDNILGVQFHPERSGPAGLRLLKYLVETGIK